MAEQCKCGGTGVVVYFAHEPHTMYADYSHLLRERPCVCCKTLTSGREQP